MKTSKCVIWRREDIVRLVEEYLKHDAFCFDTETVGTRPPIQLTAKKKDAPALDWRTNRVIWISLSTYGRADAIACGHPTGPGPLDEQLSPQEVVDLLRPLLMSDKVKIGHNLKFDILTLQKYTGDLIPGPYADTGVEAQLLNENLVSQKPGLKAYSLKGLVYRIFKFEYENLGSKGPETFPFWETGQYARYDALYNWLVHQHLNPLLEQQQVERVWDLEMKVLEVLLPMALHGALLDRSAIDMLDLELKLMITDLEERIFEVASKHDSPPPTYMREKKKFESLKRNVDKKYEDEMPWDGTFNLAAADDRGWFVYEVRRRKPWLFTEKTNKPATSEDALKVYADRDKYVAMMMEWDDLHKLHSTYVHAMRIRLSDTSTLHANFNQTGTKTGRFSSDSPNLQNIPRASTDLGKKIRSLFVAPPGYAMVVGDFDQIELRGLAHRSKDPNLMRVFIEGRDPHTETARLIMELLGMDPEEMTSEQRTIYGKTPNFAIVYGAGPARLMQSTGLSERAAKQVLDALWGVYPRVRLWSDSVVANCRQTKYVRTFVGRKRRLPEITWADLKRRGYAERQAVNTCIQGDAAEINKMALVRFHEATVGTPHQLILSVHDELVAYTPLDLVDECKAIMKEAMVGPEMQVWSVPLSAEINSGSRWSEAK